jgi:leader peptidase (prepilin peptidase)/N-methyltransferase
LIAVVSGSLVGAIVMTRKGVRAGRKTALPFGLFLAIGAVAAIFVGHPLIHWYSQHFLH